MLQTVCRRFPSRLPPPSNILDLAELREVDVPKPADGEVLIRNVTTSSNPIDVTLPLVLGYEAIGLRR